MDLSSPSASKSSKPGSVENDPYLWLEDVDGDAVLSWVDERNKETLSQFESDSRFEVFRARNEEIRTSDDRIPVGIFDGEYVYNFWTDKTNVRGILRRTTFGSYHKSAPEWETVLDVDALAQDEDENWIYQGMELLLPDNERALITLSRGGSDAACIREYDLVGKAFVAGGFSLPEAKSSMSWIDCDHVLAGTDFGEDSLTDSGYAKQLKIWKRSEPLENMLVIFEGEPSDMGVYPLILKSKGRTEVFARRLIDFFRSDFFWIGPENSIRKLPISSDSNIISMFEELVVFSIKKPWNSDGGQRFPAGAILALNLDDFLNRGIVRITEIFLPADEVAVEAVISTHDYLYVSILEQVCSRLIGLKRAGDDWVESPVDLPSSGSIAIVSSSTHHNVAFALFQSFLEPGALYVIDQAEVSSKPVKQINGHFDASGFQMQQCFAVSTDDTRIPYFLVTKKGVTHDGKTATMLFGYGGFEIPLTPKYLGSNVIQWVESGGAYAVANIRGGGELGPQWHQQALKENRQRSYDDFIAVSEDLIRTGITSPQYLGIEGGSNGGLLMGVMLTQRPDLFGAIVCRVPLLDMMRFHFLLAGASWMSEYGNPDITEERRYILGYSPYQNLLSEKKYPSMFITTSTKDDRVHPGHARKMTARLIEQEHAVHYYENIEGGHGGAANARQSARIDAMILVYLMRELKD